VIHRMLLAAAAAVSLAAATPGLAQTGSVEGPMTALNGDTLLAPDGVTILRLFGIDAPEINTIEGWGAKMVLDGMIQGSVVQCTLVSGGQLQLAAVVQRTSAVCSSIQSGGSTDLGLAMLQGGWATAQRQLLRGFSRETAYLDAERTAFDACSGFFKTKPWC
jgi:endonuclease YncB( thermonuclease family)